MKKTESSLLRHTGDMLSLAVAEENPDSFERVYEGNVDRIWRFIERLGVADRLIDDATQDTFLIAHRQLTSFRGGSTLSTWLHGIALRVAKEYRRREHFRGDWSELSENISKAEGSPFDQTSSREQLNRVLTLLEQLDEAQRTIFVLVEFEGFTAPEVAEMTSTNVNTVSTRLRAARHRFNELVQAGGLT